MSKTVFTDYFEMLRVKKKSTLKTHLIKGIGGFDIFFLRKITLDLIEKLVQTTSQFL